MLRRRRGWRLEARTAHPEPVRHLHVEELSRGPCVFRDARLRGLLKMKGVEGIHTMVLRPTAVTLALCIVVDY